MPSLPIGVQAILGPLIFSVANVSFGTMQRTDNYVFVEQKVIGNPIQQAISVGSKTITLGGVIFTEYNPNPFFAPTDIVTRKQVDNMRRIAEQLRPLNLIFGSGDVLGKWVITSISENPERFLSNGIPLKQNYNINLRAYDSSTNVGEVLNTARNILNRVRVSN